MKVAHLPYYEDNPYQKLLLQALRKKGFEAFPGGGGGRFLYTALFRWRVDVLHFHWLHPYIVSDSWWKTLFRGCQFLLELVIARCCGVRLTWTMHNRVSHSARFPRTESFFQKWTARLVHRVCVHSRQAGTIAMQDYGVSEADLVVYPHPNYLGYYPDAACRCAARDRFGLAEGATIYLFLGRILEYKGVHDLITAFRSLEDASGLLLIAGNCHRDAYRTRLLALAEGAPNIRFEFGHVSDEDLQTFMAAADAVVFPFQQILTSGSAVLASGFRKPVIVPDSPSLRESLPDNYPLTFPLPDDSEQPVSTALSQVLQEANQMRPKLQELGETCYQTVSQATWEEYAGVLGEVYSR